MPRVLVIDDEYDGVRMIARKLSANGFEAVPAITLDDARTAFAEGSWDAIVLDYSICERDNFILEAQRYAPVVIFTGDDMAAERLSKKYGVKTVHKPEPENSRKSLISVLREIIS